MVVVLTVQGLTGWEAAVPLAEETENPRRNVPRSIMASILIIGIMLVIAQWGQVIGWGTDDLPNLTNVGRGAGAGDRAPGLGRAVVADLARHDHVGPGRQPRLPERRDPHVVQHGPRRRASNDFRPSPSDAQDSDHRRNGAA